MAKESVKDRKKEIIFVLLLFIIGVPVMYSIVTSEYYTYENRITFPFWYIALGIAILAGGFLTKIYVSITYDTKKGTAIFFFSVVLIFLLVGSIFAHLNHALDSAEPERYTVTIEDKVRQSRHHRGSFTRKVTVTVNGKTVDIKIPKEHYFDLDEGDHYVVEYHQGAFHEPYYMGVGGLE